MDSVVIESEQSGSISDERFSTAVPAHIRFPAHDVPGVFLGPSHLDAEHVQGVLVVVSPDCFVYVHKLPVENRCDAVEDREQCGSYQNSYGPGTIVKAFLGALQVADLLPILGALVFLEFHFHFLL